MKRFAAVLLTLAVLLCPSVRAAGPGISAASAILIDGESGRVLYAQNAEEERPIASITKLMTALVAVESHPDLSEVVTIRPEWTGVEGSSMYLKAGEELTLEALLYGLLLECRQRRGGGGGLCQRWQRGKVRAVDESESQGAWDVQLSLYQCQRP